MLHLNILCALPHPSLYAQALTCLPRVDDADDDSHAELSVEASDQQRQPSEQQQPENQIEQQSPDDELPPRYPSPESPAELDAIRQRLILQEAELLSNDKEEKSRDWFSSAVALGCVGGVLALAAVLISKQLKTNGTFG